MKRSDLNERAAAAVERLDPEAVVAVEDTAQGRRPSQRSSRLASTARRVGSNVVARPGRLDSDLEPRTLAEFAGDPAEERIPLWIGGAVSDNRPHTLWWRADLDLLAELSHLLGVSHQHSSSSRRSP